MLNSNDRILVTHVGSLPRNQALSDLLVQREEGAPFDASQLAHEMDRAVLHVVQKQADAGIDIGNDGEQQRVAAINKGIDGIPRDRVRLHCCWGNWDGPHIHDVALDLILPVLYQANVGALSIELANPRHQHEYEALRRRRLPNHMVLLPGVIDTTTNIVEHPEVVARRLEEAVAAVGDRERVIASSDCGFGTFTGREWIIEPAVWLKLKSLRQGAEIASSRLWA